MEDNNKLILLLNKYNPNNRKHNLERALPVIKKIKIF
jgi:hypothetical protein